MAFDEVNIRYFDFRSGLGAEPEVLRKGGLKQNFKVLRRQVVELLLIRQKTIPTLSRIAIAALKIKINQLLIEIRSSTRVEKFKIASLSRVEHNF